MKMSKFNGKKNLIGNRVFEARKRLVPSCSQKALSHRLQLLGVECDRVAITRIENGQRFVADFELKYLAIALDVSVAYLIGEGIDD